jgi:FkbM family methyltransferase
VNFIERTCISIRHSQRLARADWLWNAARPFYDSVVNTVACSGLDRVINGTDRILISPKYRNIGELYEPEVWKHLMSNVRPGDVIADVGAHIGLYTIALAKRLNVKGHIVAFEPDEDNFQDMTAHIALNGLEGTAHPVRAAVGTVDGEIGFTCDQDTQNRILPQQTPNGRTVPAIRLDSFFDRQRVDILKVDVEGFEEEVLKGGLQLLSDSERAPRLIYLEVHPYNWELCGTTSESLLRHLHESGYDVETPDGTPCTKISSYGEVIALR